MCWVWYKTFWIYQKIKGTFDILPPETQLWQEIEAIIHQTCQQFGFEEIRTPAVELVNLFQENIGYETDVSKEMFGWEDQSGKQLALKPEMTAPVVRAYIESGFFRKHPLCRLYYIDSLFRRENPQKGRQRQFNQFGVEAFGSKNSEQDAEVILIANKLFTELKINNTILSINSIGSNSAGGTANVLTLSTAHNFINGETVRVLSDTGQLPDGLVANTVYYAITSGSGISTNVNIKIGKTLDDALKDNELAINNKGGVLEVVSRVTDKNSGDIGHPIQYDSSQSQWYVNVSTSSTDNTIYPTIVGLGSTALGDGLALGVDMASSIPNKNKVVILLSDGEHNAGFLSPDDAIGLALIKNIQVNTIAMGSSEPVLLAVNPISGQPTYAGVDEDTLIKIAHYAGGKFYKSVDNSSLEEIFSTLGDNIDREVEQLSIKDWFFIPAVVLLALNVYIIYGRYKIIA